MGMCPKVTKFYLTNLELDYRSRFNIKSIRKFLKVAIKNSFKINEELKITKPYTII